MPDTSGHPVPATMRALLRERYGDASVLRVGELPTPAIDDEHGVLVDVHAAGVDRGAWHLMTGLPYLIRPAYGVRRPKHPVFGLDVAGRVAAVGSAVTRFRPGDEVFGFATGSFAEYAVAEEDKLSTKPPGVGFEAAASAPVSGITALQALTDVGRLEVGQSVLVLGASGGVGTYAVQLAVAMGATVTGVCGPDSQQLVRELGATRTVDHTTTALVDIGDTFDLVIDIGGRNRIRDLRRVLTPSGTLVVVGGEGGNRFTGGFGRSIRAALLSPFVKQRLTMFVSKEHHSLIDRLAEHLADGSVVPSIGDRFGLDDSAEALRRIDTHGARGKSVIVVRPE